jgi:cyclopropane fatty-acyl-phospholipid synthase-like methyltransferase
MGYYDSEKNVNDYIEMAKGFDGAELIKVLRNHLPEGSTVLELGMGPGKDLALLAEWYEATGSDSSRVFVDLYRRSHPESDLLLLDATTMETDRSFDGVYSNKVLQHLTKEQLRVSLQKQRYVLKSRGVLMHSFWYGTGEEEHQGLLSVYYTEIDLENLVGKSYEVEELERYKEMEDGDSIYMVLRKIDG